MKSLNRNTPFLMILIFLIATSLACQFGAKTTQTTSEPGQAEPNAAQNEPGSKNTGKTAVSGQQQSGTTGEFNLTDPTAGLSGLENYHQTLTVTIKGAVKGQPYENSMTTLRDVVGTDSAVHVTTQSGSSASGFRTIYLGAYKYTQGKPGQACNTTSDEEATEKSLENPASQLPGLYGLGKPAEENYGDAPAKHYTFDQRALPMQVGKNGKATGDLFLAEDGQTVLQYTLTIEVKDGDFKGTRSFSYSLETGTAPDIRLPEPCQPVLTDFPEMEGARDLIRKPAFMRYTISVKPDNVRSFYLATLPGLGWQPLPGTTPSPTGEPAPAANATDPLILSFGRANEDGTGQVAVIQAIPKEDALMVVVQTTQTKKAIQVGVDSSAPAGEGNDSSTEPLPDMKGTLPNIPLYPGANVITQTDSMLALDTTDAVEKVMEYYTGQLETDGWEKTQDNSAAGNTVQNWEKDGIQLMVAYAPMSGKTRVMLTAVKMP